MFFFVSLVFFILSIKTIIFNTLIDSSSLNIFSSLLPYLLGILERTKFLSQFHDNLCFSNSLYVLHLEQ